MTIASVNSFLDYSATSKDMYSIIDITEYSDLCGKWHLISHLLMEYHDLIPDSNFDWILWVQIQTHYRTI